MRLNLTSIDIDLALLHYSVESVYAALVSYLPQHVGHQSTHS